MKNKLLISILIIVNGALSSCSTIKYEHAYPLDICLVSDNELGSMGKVTTRVYQGQEIKLCCKPCVKKFDEDPEKYLKKLPPIKK
jgi:hypothetical protein